MRLLELAKVVCVWCESALVDEMSEQLKFLQGDRPEFLGNK